MENTARLQWKVGLMGRRHILPCTAFHLEKQLWYMVLLSIVSGFSVNQGPKPISPSSVNRNRLFLPLIPLLHRVTSFFGKNPGCQTHLEPWASFLPCGGLIIALSQQSLSLTIKSSPAPVGLLSWLEHHPVHQRVAGLIPGQDTYLGCRFNPHSGCILEATNWCFSLSLSLPL